LLFFTIIFNQKVQGKEKLLIFALTIKKDKEFYKVIVMSNLLKYVTEQQKKETTFPKFRAGDNVTVGYKIIEGAKERIQDFKGDVIQIKGEGLGKTFTVRKMSNGIGVERIFPLCATTITEIRVNKYGRVRRAKLYYLRELIGKKARIKERKFIKQN